MNTTAEFIGPEHGRWVPMWEALAAATGDHADYNEESGERWQYLGTFSGQHQFRHRHRPESAQPITGYAGQHIDRVYLHLDAETLKPTRVHVRRYLGDEASLYAGHVHGPDGTAPRKSGGASDCTGEEHQRMNCPRCGGNHPLRDCPRPDREQFEANCSGSFDGFNVTSDADPGL